MSKHSKKNLQEKPENSPNIIAKHSGGMVSYGSARGRHRNKVNALPEGFYVFAWRASGTPSEWVAICPCFPDNPDHMRFLRLDDAQRAADSLIAAGLDHYRKLVRAKPEYIRKIACENLAW